MSLALRILVDNEAPEPFRREHGLSVLVSKDGRDVLFDAAASAKTLLANAGAMGVDLAKVDSAVVSHGHYDHTGALAAVADGAKGLRIFAHPSAFLRRWADKPGRPLKDISCPHAIDKLASLGATVHAVEAPEILAEGMLLSGPIGGPSTHACERFVIRKGGQILVDRFEDETVMLVRGREGWVVITGCCHRGLRNTLRLAKFLARGEPLAAIVGGLHLRSANEAALAEAASALADFGRPAVYPCHCTGAEATAFLVDKLGENVHPVRAGMQFTL